MTLQQQALRFAKKRFGTSAFTEDTINYRRVGFTDDNGKILIGIGETWAEAFENLYKKVVPKVD